MLLILRALVLDQENSMKKLLKIEKRLIMSKRVNLLKHDTFAVTVEQLIQIILI